MRRREIITLLGGAAAWPVAARAQQTATIPKVGIIFPRPATAAADNIAALKNGLRDLGYIEGETFLADWFFSEGNYEQIPAVVERMIRGGANLLLVGGHDASNDCTQVDDEAHRICWGQRSSWCWFSRKPRPPWRQCYWFGHSA
jgi:putative ABC transport system substrate-binding protein